MKEVFRAANDERDITDGETLTEDEEKAVLARHMKSKILLVYKPGLNPTNTEELLSMSDSQKLSFNDLIQQQWFGSNFFQVFINKKDCGFYPPS